MSECINVLYIFDDKYAEIAGVSIYTLLEAHKDLEVEVYIYILVTELSEPNVNKIKQTVDSYGQQFQIVDINQEYAILKDKGVSSYRGSSATNLRLHFIDYIPDSVERLIYIDADTIIEDQLVDLYKTDMGNHLLGMSYDAYGNLEGLAQMQGKPYYCAGVILFDCKKWREESVRKQIDTFIELKGGQYSRPDQDILNMVCEGRVLTLPLKYNLQTIHRMYSYDECKNTLPDIYYGKSEIDEAVKRPAIIHLIRVFGSLPWSTNSIHPDKLLFAEKKQNSAWKDCASKNEKRDIVMRIEYLLYRILPAKFFMALSYRIILFQYRVVKSGKY